MLRFILKRSFRDDISQCCGESLITVDCDVPALEELLRRGGYGPSGFDRYDLQGAEVRSGSADDEVPADIESLVAEVNRRRGEMAVARECLDECGIPAKEDGITLTTSQRIRRLADRSKDGEKADGGI